MRYTDNKSGRKTLSRSTSSRSIDQSNGFSAVELLITLFIASAFLISGYQLYAVVIKDGGEASTQARAVSVTTDYLKRYESSATNPCTELTPLTNSPITVTGLSNVTVTVARSCPYSSIPAPKPEVSKILVTLQYGTPQKILTNATYVSP